MSIGYDWNVNFRYGIHDHDLVEYLEGHDILGCLKFDKRLFLSDMAKYHMV